MPKAPPKDTVIVEPGPRLDTLLSAIGNALWAINDQLKPIDNAIENQTTDITKWLGAITDAIKDINPLPPQPITPRGTIMSDYQVPADQADGRVTFHIEATDSEGNPITDAAELAKLGFEVINSNSAAFEVTMDADQPDPANRVGGYHVGAPGQGAVTSNLKQADGDIIATGTDGFTVTTGEAELGSVTGTFDGLTPIV